jgi:hypothetical protein
MKPSYEAEKSGLSFISVVFMHLFIRLCLRYSSTCVHYNPAVEIKNAYHHTYGDWDTFVLKGWLSCLMSCPV